MVFFQMQIFIYLQWNLEFNWIDKGFGNNDV